jgi:general secretion pathway protein A
MYEQFFGLTEKPFSIQPDPSFLYWGRTHRLAYAMLEYGVLNYAGISVISGEVGCGKTTLVHRLLDQLSDTHTVALLSNIQEGRGDLLSWVLMGYGQPFSDANHVALFSQLQSFFIGEYAKGKRVVLIIDEAQNLSMDMLEELRLLSNINAGKDQLLQLILVGQPELKDVLNRPELLQLTQRIGSDFHLTPLSRDEVHAYIETRLSIAGCRRRIFTERAIDLIAEQSRGVPRVINIIADTALVYAFSAEDLVVGVETIRSVVRDKKAYGVFGIASKEPTAPPIAPSEDEDEGPDAFFARRPNSLDGHGDDDASMSSFRAADGGAASVANLQADVRARLSGGRAGAQPAAAYQPVREEAPAREAAPHLRPAAIVEAPDPTPAPTPAAAPEPAVLTGVVIVGTDPRMSPEAAVRSAGTDRPIVFVPMTPMSEAAADAKKAGAEVVEPGKGLQTGGRAKNAGYRQLKKIAPEIAYVQFIDAGAALDPDWIASAERFMQRRPEVAVIDGRLFNAKGAPLSYATLAEQRERDASGEIVSVAGGGAFVRAEAFEAAGGFRGDLLSSEVDDLCIRQRRRGAHIWRLDAGMAISKERRRRSWWSRAVLRGFDNAYAMSLHGGPPERYGVAETASAIGWGLLFPLFIVLAAGASAVIASQLAPLMKAPLVAAGVLAFGAAVYGLKILASVLARGPFRIASWGEAFGAVLGRFPEALGVLSFWFGGDRPAK